MYTKTQDLLNKDILTYSEILAIRSRMSGYKRMTDEHKEEAKQAELKEEYMITPEHTAKGLEYLFRVSFKPSMLETAKAEYKKTETILDEAIRKNSPLGYRELHILLSFDHFTFSGFYDATNVYQQDLGFKNLYPLWTCYDNEGDSFQYYIEGGVMNIIG